MGGGTALAPRQIVAREVRTVQRAAKTLNETPAGRAALRRVLPVVAHLAGSPA